MLPLTFALQTRAGTVGLLQIVDFTDSPRGIRIRYKLVIERAPWVRGEIGGIPLKPRS